MKQPIFSFNLTQILREVDPDHIHHAEHTAELKEPFLMRAYGSSMVFGTYSSKYAKNHIIWKQKVIFKDFVVIARDKEIPIGDAVRYAIENLDLHISCRCPAFLYYGYRYMGTQLDYLYGLPRENRPPDRNNPRLRGSVCKHADRVLRWIVKNEEEIVRRFEALYRDVDFSESLDKFEEENPDETKELYRERRDGRDVRDDAGDGERSYKVEKPESEEAAKEKGEPDEPDEKGDEERDEEGRKKMQSSQASLIESENFLGGTVLPYRSYGNIFQFKVTTKEGSYGVQGGFVPLFPTLGAMCDYLGVSYEKMIRDLVKETSIDRQTLSTYYNFSFEIVDPYGRQYRGDDEGPDDEELRKKARDIFSTVADAMSGAVRGVDGVCIMAKGSSGRSALYKRLFKHASEFGGHEVTTVKVSDIEFSFFARGQAVQSEEAVPTEKIPPVMPQGATVLTVPPLLPGKSKKRKAPAKVESSVHKCLRDDLDMKARRAIGVTDDAYSAGYIMTDGTLLDFSDGGRGRVMDHRTLGAIDDKELDARTGTEKMLYFMKQTGAVRFSASSNSAYSIGIPTHAQIRVIAGTFQGQKRVFLDVVDDNGDLHSHELYTPYKDEIFEFYNNANVDHWPGDLWPDEEDDEGQYTPDNEAED